MTSIRIKNLGLSTGDQNKLIELREKEERLYTLLRNFDLIRINKEIEEIDEEVADLLIKKAEIVSKRLDPSEVRSTELNRSIQTCKQNQVAIIMQHSIIGKLAKTINKVKECESELVTQTQSE